MPVFLKALLFLFVVAFVMACGGESDALPGLRDGGSSQAPFGQQASSGQGLPGAERLIVRDFTLELVVDDLTGAIGRSTAIAEERRGFVVSLTRNSDTGASLSLRVPADRVVEAVEQLKELAKRVEKEQSNAQDVTEEYVDLQSRLKNLEASEAQLMTIMERADTVEDVLRVQRELTSVRERIEQTQGRIQFLESSAAMALIRVTLRTAASSQPLTRGGWDVAETWRTASRGFVTVGQVLVDVAVWVLVFSPLWGAGLAIYGFVWWRQRRERPT